MNKRYQIFISSTYNDLKEERQKVIQAILGIYHFPIGMEMFHADNKEQWEQIKKTIDTSDYYILIIGRYCGTLIDNENISYTEKEYNYAKNKGIPIIPFIIDENAKKESYGEESQKQIKALRKFKKKVLKQPCEFWLNPDDLAYKVTKTLNIKFSEEKRYGWSRNIFTGFNIPEFNNEYLVGEYNFISLRAKSINSNPIVSSKLIIKKDGSVDFLNNINGDNCEYSYHGICEDKGNILYIHLINEFSNERIFIEFIKAVGNLKRFIGLMIGLSADNIPVCVKVACYKKELETNINKNKIIKILSDSNKWYKNNALIIEENAKNIFYSDAIFN